VEVDNHALAADIINGFFAGLASAGVRSIDPLPAEFEAAFSHAWADWPPASSGELAQFKAGRYGYKALLYRARRPDSLFREYRTSIDALPNWLTIEQVLNACAAHATPGQWHDLAGLYLQHSRNNDAIPVSQARATKSENDCPPSKPVTVPVVRQNGIRVPGGIIRRSKPTSSPTRYFSER
jgi:hypothetical protein